MANGGIKAQVINILNNQPIDNATLKVSGAADLTTQTGNDGYFEFTNLSPSNDYNLNLTANGFEPEYYSEIVVIDGIVTDLGKLVLRPTYD